MLFTATLGKRIDTSAIACFCLLVFSATAFGQGLNQVQPYQLFQAARADKDYVEAANYGRQVLAAAEDEYGASSLDLIDPLERLADVLVLAGQLDSATEHYSRALTLMEDSLGSGHPELIPTLDALADIATAQENYAEAEAQFDAFSRLKNRSTEIRARRS